MPLYGVVLGIDECFHWPFTGLLIEFEEDSQAEFA